MSWMMIFISGFFPILWLLILLATRRLQGTTALAHGKNPRSHSMKRAMMVLMAVFAGMLSGTVAHAQDQRAKANGSYVSTFLEANGQKTPDKEWKVATVELAPGAVDSRSILPGTGVVYVIEGGGILEMDGKASMALRPGVSVVLNHEKPHVLKNTSETATLRVVMVLQRDRNQQGRLIENPGAKGQSKHTAHEGTRF